MNLKSILKDYEYYLKREKGYSINTINSYLKDISLYLDYLIKKNNINNIKEIKEEDILKYLKKLKKDNISSTSISRKISAIKNFHNFYKLEYDLKDVSFNIKTPKIEKKLPQVLSVEEINRLIDSIDLKTPIGLRNKALIETLYATGLRVSELLNIKLSDINLNKSYIITLGKGDKERKVIIGEYALQAIKTYILEARTKLLKGYNPYLFLNYKGEQISRQGFYKILDELRINANIDKEISPHTLRHSFATHLLQNGVDLRYVQELLGHTNLQTTQIYTHIAKDKLKETFLYANPRRKEDKDE